MKASFADVFYIKYVNNTKSSVQFQYDSQGSYKWSQPDLPNLVVVQPGIPSPSYFTQSTRSNGILSLKISINNISKTCQFHENFQWSNGTFTLSAASCLLLDSTNPTTPILYQVKSTATTITISLLTSSKAPTPTKKYKR